jgi:hypothetical protein
MIERKTDSAAQILKALNALSQYKWAEQFKAELAKTDDVYMALENAIPDYIEGWEVGMIRDSSYWPEAANKGDSLSGIVEYRNIQHLIM